MPEGIQRTARPAGSQVKANLTVGGAAIALLAYYRPEIPPVVLSAIPVIALTAVSWLGQKARDLSFAYENQVPPRKANWIIKGLGLG